MRSLLPLVATLISALPFALQDAPDSGPSKVELAMPTVSVDPRVELCTLVARLAGFEEFNPPVGLESFLQPAGQWAYTRSADAAFEDFKEHQVVRSFQILRSTDGLSHDAVASLAVHLTWNGGAVALRPEVELELQALEAAADGADGPAPGRLGERWRRAAVRQVVGELGQFIEEADFIEWFEAREPERRLVEERFRAFLRKDFRPGWFPMFFGGAPGAGLDGPDMPPNEVELNVHLGLFQRGNNFGVGVRFADGRELLSPCIGSWNFDAEGMPTYGLDHLPLVVHEFCHSYADPIADALAAELEAEGAEYFPLVERVMGLQAYRSWKVVLRENLVRACVQEYLSSGGFGIWPSILDKWQDLAQEQSRQDAMNGFDLIEPMRSAIRASRITATDNWSLGAAKGELVQAVKAAVTERLEREAAERPKVISMTPYDGATVPAGEAKLKIVFDRPMDTGSYSVTRTAADFPAVTGTPSWSADGLTFVVPVRLEAGKTYGFGLNGGGQTGFRDAKSGTPAAPREVTFSVE